MPVCIRQVDELEGYAYLAGHHLCHLAVLLPLAFPVQGPGDIVPVLHEQREHIVPGLPEQQRRHRRIHSAGKPYGNSLTPKILFYFHSRHRS